MQLHKLKWKVIEEYNNTYVASINGNNLYRIEVRGEVFYDFYDHDRKFYLQRIDALTAQCIVYHYLGGNDAAS